MIRLETVAVLTIWLHDDDDNDDNDKAVAHDLLAASKWASTRSAGQLQRARTTTIVRELGPEKLCMPHGRSVQCVDRRR